MTDDFAPKFVLIGTGRSRHHDVAEWIALKLGRGARLATGLMPNGHFQEHMLRQGAKTRGPYVATIDDRGPAAMCAYDHITPRSRILVMRDAYNWLASTLASCRARHEPIEPLVAQWKAWARVAAATPIASGGKATDVIRLNTWLVSPEYRSAIEEAYDLEPDTGPPWLRNRVRQSPFGGHGTVERIGANLLTRWHKFEYDDEFRSLIDDEMITLTQTIFEMKGPP